MAKPKTERGRLLAKLHIAVQANPATDQEYRDWLEVGWGVRSSADLSLNQLRQAIGELERAGWLDGLARGGDGEDRPTAKQWNFLAALSRNRGWDGLEAPQLATFVKRIAKVDSPRFLTRQGMSKVINGLKKWAEQQAPQSGGGGV